MTSTISIATLSGAMVLVGLQLEYPSHASDSGPRYQAHYGAMLLSASPEWRNPECGCWIYSPSEPIEHGLSVWVLTDKALAPLDDDFTADYFLASEGGKGEDLRDPVSSTLALLTINPVIQESDIRTLCRILHDMLFKERWTPPGGSIKEQEVALLDGEQLPLLYDEALRRLRCAMPDTPILDIRLGTSILASINWAR